MSTPAFHLDRREVKELYHVVVLLSCVSTAAIEESKLQALIGAVQARLAAKTESERIQAEKQVQIAEAAARVVENAAAVEIVRAMGDAATEQALIKEAATVAAIRILRQ